MTGYQFIAQTLAKMQNRLFAANITENTWIPEDEDGNDYDARAYRANSEGSVQLLSSLDSNNIRLSITDDEAIKRIPTTHDCINPFNNVKYTKMHLILRIHIYTIKMVNQAVMVLIQNIHS